MSAKSQTSTSAMALARTLSGVIVAAALLGCVAMEKLVVEDFASLLLPQVLCPSRSCMSVLETQDQP